MTMYLLTEQEHAQIAEALELPSLKTVSMLIKRDDALAMLKAMKPMEPKGWVTQAGTVTGGIAGDGSAHDGELYGWIPLYAKEQQ